MKRILCVLVLFSVTGCATSLTEEERLEREYAIVENQEAIREFVRNCELAGHQVVYSGPVYQKLRDPVRRVPKHARLTDYQCANERAVAREFGLSGQ